MSPRFVKKHVFKGKKHVFLTKNGLINSGFMSIKQLDKERQPSLCESIVSSCQKLGNILENKVEIIKKKKEK